MRIGAFTQVASVIAACVIVAALLGSCDLIGWQTPQGAGDSAGSQAFYSLNAKHVAEHLEAAAAISA